MINGELKISSEIERDTFIRLISDLQIQITPSLDEMGVDIKEYADKLYKNADVLVAYNKGEVVGVAAVYTNDAVSKCAYLSFIALFDKYIGKGYGRQMLKRVEYVARSLNMRTLRLEVYKRNYRARQFYRHMGYDDVEEKEESFYMEKNFIINKNI